MRIFQPLMCTLLLIGGIVSVVAAQKVPPDKVFIALYGGKTTTTFFGKAINSRIDSPYAPDAYVEERNGIIVGAEAKVTLNDYFFIRPGIAYAQRGAMVKDDDYSLYPFQAYLDYLSVPLLIGVQPLNFANVREVNVYIEGGIVSSFEVSRSKDEYLYKGYSQKPTVNKQVFSFQLGAGVEVRLVEGFAVFGKYSYFEDFTEFFSVFNTDPYKAYHKGTSITVGCMLDVTAFTRD